MSQQPCIEVRMMGDFSITREGRPLLQALGQDSKPLQLLQYLMLHGERTVTHEELISHFWSGDADAETSLRAVMHRLRRVAAQEECGLENWIATTRGCYAWNAGDTCRIDVCELERLAALAAKEENADVRDAQEQEIVRLYRGRLLPGLTGEPWVERRQLSLRTQYKAALYHQIDRSKEKGDPAAVEALCRGGLQLDPTDERLYMESILALQALGLRQQAQELAAQAEERGCLYTDGRNPAAIASSYCRMRQAESGTIRDLEHTADAITQGAAGSGAYICGYDTFLSISRVQLRTSIRYNQPLFLAIIRLIPPAARPAAGRTAAVMQVLEGVLTRTLRSSDVAARYDENSFVLLLKGTEDKGNSPMERIRSAFYRTPAHDGYLLTYRLRTPRTKL